MNGIGSRMWNRFIDQSPPKPAFAAAPSGRGTRARSVRRSTRRSRSSPRCRCRTGSGTARRRRRSSRRLRPTRWSPGGFSMLSTVPTWWPRPRMPATCQSRNGRVRTSARARQPAWNSRLSSSNGAGSDADRARDVDRARSVARDRHHRLLRERHPEPADQQIVARDGERERRIGVPARPGAEEVDQRRVHGGLTVERDRQPRRAQLLRRALARRDAQLGQRAAARARAWTRRCG